MLSLRLDKMKRCLISHTFNNASEDVDDTEQKVDNRGKRKSR